MFSIFTKSLLLLVGLFLPSLTLAAGLVECVGTDCGTCELIETGNTVLSFIITVMMSVASLLFVYAGFLMVTSGGDVSAYNKAKGIFTNVLIGIIIMMCAWLIIDTVLKTFLEDGAGVAGNTRFGPWNTVDCTEQIDLVDVAEGTKFYDSWDLLNQIILEHSYDGGEIRAGDPNLPDGMFDFIMYELSSTHHADCRIEHSGVYVDQAECAAGYNRARESASGPTSLVNDCDELGVVAPAPWVATVPDCDGSGGGGPSCGSDTSLIAAYHGSPRGVNAPGLDAMISCIRDNANVASKLDTSQIYTYDNSHPECGPTNGNRVCGSCSHSINSCHYGSGTGQGAMAVDFNATDGSASGERALYEAIRAVAVRCGAKGTPLFEGNHTHVTLSSCPSR